METVLLVDDDKIFRALEGTCLRRDVCRLVKARPDRLLAAAHATPPDLIVLPLSDAESRRLLREVCASPELGAVPVIALALVAGVRGAPPAKSADRKGSVEVIAARKGRSGAPDLAGLDHRLDAAIKRLLPVLNRKSDRVTVSLPVRCRGKGFSFTVRTKNISPSGLFLRTERELPPGARFRFEFNVPSPARPDAGGGKPDDARPARRASVSGTCQVVRRVSPADQEDWDLIPGVGVRFVEIEGRGKVALHQLVQGRSRSSRAPGRRAVPAAQAAH